MKKIISLMLSVVVVFSITIGFSSVIYANDISTIEASTRLRIERVYSYSGGTVTITANLFTTRTPNNTVVNIESTINELPDAAIEEYDDSMSAMYPNAIQLRSASAKYNCHSYAWYSQLTTNTVWMPDPSAYYTDGSYTRVSSPAVNDIICYYNASGTLVHSGIVIAVSSGTANNVCGNSNLVTVRSKWGANGLYEHRGDQCPYTTYNPLYDFMSAAERASTIGASVRYYRAAS